MISMTMCPFGRTARMHCVGESIIQASTAHLRRSA